jgi:hypothetical protein
VADSVKKTLATNKGIFTRLTHPPLQRQCLLRVANVINHRHAFGLVNNHGGLKIYNGAELEARMPIMKTATRFQFWAVRFIFREEAAQ